MKEIIGYLDEDHNTVEASEAKWKVIHKYDDEGEQLLDEIWVELPIEEEIEVIEENST